MTQGSGLPGPPLTRAGAGRAQGRCPQPPAPSPQPAGQALVELAVFGSLLLLLLGYLVNTVLGYDYQMQAKTEAFRRSLSSAAVSSLLSSPLSTSHLLIQDRQLADPSDPFALGPVSPVMATAGVTRAYNLQTLPGEARTMPRLAIQIADTTVCPETLVGPSSQSGMLTCNYTLAGFRFESTWQASLARYKFIYGEANVCDDAKKCPGAGSSICAPGGWVTDINPDTNEEQTVCVDYLKTIRITDPCEGEIISLPDCRRQAGQIADNGMCEAACRKAGKADCATMCSQTMVVPWYAAGTSCGGGKCAVPVLDGRFAGMENAGLQPGSTQEVVKDNQLIRQESPGDLQSTMVVDATTKTDRTVVRTSGQTAVNDTITAQKTDQSTTTWSTPW